MTTTTNWEVGGRHWDKFYDKRSEVWETAKTRNLSIGDAAFHYDDNMAITRIYLRNEHGVRTRVVATIKTFYPKDKTNTAHYYRMCQLLNYFEPEFCHFYDPIEGWTTRPREITVENYDASNVPRIRILR
jgi:hypothetical protein